MHRKGGGKGTDVRSWRSLISRIELPLVRKKGIWGDQGREVSPSEEEWVDNGVNAS